MLIACWSVKGGVGTTVVAASLAVLLARAAPQGVLLVDLGGDAAVMFGREDEGRGIEDWLGKRKCGSCGEEGKRNGLISIIIYVWFYI